MDTNKEFTDYEAYKEYVNSLTDQERTAFYDGLKRKKYKKILDTLKQSLAYWRERLKKYPEGHDLYWLCRSKVNERYMEVWKYRRAAYGK